jgi:uncharacterized membrane protein
VGSVAITTVPSEATAHFGETAGVNLLSRPNRSLSIAARKWVCIAMCMPVAIVGIVVAAQGAWLVMPFAGIEIALIVFAFRWLRAGDGDFESVRVHGDEVVLVRSVRGVTSESRFNLHWVQVVFEPAGIARKGLLALRSHGRLYRLGDLMTEPERSAAAGYLAARLRFARALRA